MGAAQMIGRVSEWVGWLCGVLVILLTLNIFYDVLMRYLFSGGSLFWQEMEWLLFSALFLLGIAYAMKHDAHVRVDIFYEKFSDKQQAWVNLLGTILFVIPLSGLILYTSYDFVFYAWEINEQSPDPGGIPHRWLIKALIPLAFALVILQAFVQAIHEIRVLLNQESETHEPKEMVL